jgi:hypothetical protein
MNIKKKNKVFILFHYKNIGTIDRFKIFAHSIGLKV